MTSRTLNRAGIAAAALLLAVGGPLLVRELGSLPGAQALGARAGERIVTLEVAGMTCSGCSGKVQSELAALEGVSSVSVRLDQARAYVVCDPAVPDSALTATVKGAGPAFIARVVAR